ncbi:MAG: twin-arginine translocation signal domain-containing protein, partial [Roseiflexaceae bacterium]
MPRSIGQPNELIGNALSRRRFLALAAAGTAGLVAARTSGAEAQGDETRAQIAVDAGRVLWRIPATVRGFNFRGIRSDAAFMPEYRKIGLNLLRFPPGQDGDQADLEPDLIDDSAKVTQALGGELVVEVRLRGG